MEMPKFDKYVENKKDKLSKNTINTYTQLYKKMYKHFNKEPVDIDEDILIDSIKQDMLTDKGQVITNPNTLTSLFNTVIIVKKEFDLPITKLLKAKENLLSDIYDHREAQKIKNAHRLPSFKDVKSHLKKQFDNEDHIGYILNFMMQNFFTRNKDLDIYITTTLKLAKDPEKNYLVIRNWDIIYIKNVYKTAKSYGSMKFTFRDRKLTYAIQKFIESQTANPLQTEWALIQNANGFPLDESSQAKFIRKHTLNGMSESDIFKIRVDDFEKRGDIKGLMEASRRRGTNLTTLIKNYSLTMKPP
tara:strand:- start:1653 stop:2558 length:906 start_codon:yes stop_codon:yes gene_type:complete